MKRADLNGIAVGDSITGHTAFVLGVVLFCWGVSRFVGMASKRP